MVTCDGICSHDEDEKKFWGCPFDARFTGKGATKKTDGICPTGLSCEFSRSVMELLDDYEANRLGNVREELGSATLAYLKIAKSEKEEWLRDKMKNKEKKSG